MQQPDDDARAAAGAAPTRPPVCLSCGGARFKNARAGVTRVREELEALVGEPVARSPPPPTPTRRCRGSWSAPRRCCSASTAPTPVAFLDLDQELLAPRYRAAEQALALLARAARVVAASGPAPGRAAGHLLLQTRLPDHEVVQAAVHADVAAGGRRRSEPAASSSGSRPCSAMAEVSGAAAPAFVDALGRADRRRGGGGGRRAAGGCAPPTTARSATPWPRSRRPAGRLRIEVDPLRI